MEELSTLGTALEQVAKPTLLDHPSVARTAILVLPPKSSATVYGEVTQARQHRFTDLDSFCRWLARDLATAPRLESLVGAAAVVASLNPFDPNADELRCSLLDTPEFAAWKSTLGKPMKHREFYLLLLATRDTLMNPPADVLLQAVGKLKVTAGAELTAEIDDRGFYKVHGKSASTTIAASIPNEITASVPIYRGLVDSGGVSWKALLRFQLVIDFESATDPKFTLTCPDLDVHLDAARRAVADMVGRAVPGRLVGLGEWSVVSSIVGTLPNP